jgi:hypothetical protein
VAKGACLEGEALPGGGVADIDDVRGAVADVVIKEDLDDVLVGRIQQQQLPRAAALVAALPERVVVSERVCPGQHELSSYSVLCTIVSRFGLQAEGLCSEARVSGCPPVAQPKNE